MKIRSNITEPKSAKRFIIRNLIAANGVQNYCMLVLSSLFY